VEKKTSDKQLGLLQSAASNRARIAKSKLDRKRKSVVKSDMSTVAEQKKLKESLKRKKCLSVCMNEAGAADKRKLTAYYQLVFQGKKTSIKRMNEFFEGYSQDELSDPDREVMNKAIQTICQKEGWSLFIDGIECTLTVTSKSKGPGKRFKVREKEDSSHSPWAKTGLPPLTVRAL